MQETVASIRPRATQAAPWATSHCSRKSYYAVWKATSGRAHAIDAHTTQALSPLLIMGVLMLAVGRYDADLETLLPGVTERFEVAVGKAFVEDRDQLNSACSLIGVLKVLVVLNIGA